MAAEYFEKTTARAMRSLSAQYEIYGSKQVLLLNRNEEKKYQYKREKDTSTKKLIRNASTPQKNYGSVPIVRQRKIKREYNVERDLSGCDEEEAGNVAKHTPEELPCDTAINSTQRGLLMTMHKPIGTLQSQLESR